MANKKNYDFLDLANDLKKVSENLYTMMDDTFFSYVFVIGSKVMYRTPRDTGRAVFNWITAIDSSWTGLRMTERNTPPDANSGLNFAVDKLWSILLNFNSRVNHTLTITNNLDYIYRLAYLNWAKRPRTRPHAPSGWMIEQNVAEESLEKYIKPLFRGI